MKRLIRLLLVNWYRIEQQSIEIEGHTAVIGPNASGKSSLLDAVQAVLVGGHKDWWRPNASAGEKSTRSLRDYCLGMVRDPGNQELSSEFRPRSQSLTHLVLVFRDDDAELDSGGEAVSVGLALHARLDESSEQVDGRFIAPGLELFLGDLTDRDMDGETTPKPWLRLREDLRSKAGSRLILEKSPERFQEQLCVALSDGRRHLDRKRFLRAFRNAITFSPIKNVSDFVRGQILEQRDIEVKALQQALQNYREIRRRTEEANQREQALAGIEGHYQRADQAQRLNLSWLWVEQESLFNALETELGPLRESIAAGDRQIQALVQQLSSLKQQWDQADAALQQANQRLGQTDVVQQRALLKEKRESAARELQHLADQIARAGSDLGRIHRVMDHAALLRDADQDDVLEACLVDLLPHLPEQDSLLADSWPMDAVGIDALVARLMPLLDDALAALRQRRDEAAATVSELEKELQQLRERIARMESSGGSDLSPATQRLQVLLAEHGIEAVPLCDRVELADEDWRDAVEAFLGGHREALLVHPDEVREAILLYRRQGRKQGIHGSRIINTRKSAEWLRRRDDGSLAEVIRSDDEHVTAYINRRAGNVLRVDDEQALTRHERAITQDGMLATGGAITRLRPLEPMLGREARERALVMLKQSFQAMAEDHGRAKHKKEGLEGLIDQVLTPFRSRLGDWPEPVGELGGLTGLSHARRQRLTEVAGLVAREQALQDDDSYRRLKGEADQAERHRNDIDEQRKQAGNDQAALTKQQEQAGNNRQKKQAESTEAADQRSRIEALHGFDAGDAGERVDEIEAQMLLTDEGADSYRALARQAEQRAAGGGKKMHRQRNLAREALRDYLANWPNDQAPAVGLDDDYLGMAEWVQRTLENLRDTALGQYAREADSALREAETAFRADFVGKLQENLHLLESQRKELNANLRRRPFHGQYYHFIKRPNRELESVLNWVESWTPEQGGDVGGLFDAGNDPNHPHYEGITRIKELLLAAGEADGGSGWDDRLSDYRQYYHFDVKMTDDQDGQKNAELLSRRLGKGSGGEHQSPFYVAIGAALAAAYRIERDPRGGHRGGMGLAVFDEAFSKLDLQNTVSALGFLDELGLQVLLAAPDEKYGQIAAHVDTIINVYRDGGDVFIDAEYIKPAAQRALAADNPTQGPAQLSAQDSADEPPPTSPLP